MNFPSPVIQTPQQYNPRYDVMGQRAGQMFADLTTAIAKIPQDVKAYETLKNEEGNLASYKSKLVNGVLADIGQDWSEGDRQMFVSSVRSAKNIEELFAKGNTLYANRTIQKKHNIPIAPQWGQLDYANFIRPWKEDEKKRQDKEQFRKEKAAIEKRPSPPTSAEQAKAWMVEETERPISKIGETFAGQYGTLAQQARTKREASKLDLIKKRERRLARNAKARNTKNQVFYDSLSNQEDKLMKDLFQITKSTEAQALNPEEVDRAEDEIIEKINLLRAQMAVLEVAGSAYNDRQKMTMVSKIAKEVLSGVTEGEPHHTAAIILGIIADDRQGAIPIGVAAPPKSKLWQKKPTEGPVGPQLPVQRSGPIQRQTPAPVAKPKKDRLNLYN